MDQSLNMVKIAYDALDDKLAEDIKIIDIRSISVLADYFIIADGNNKNQVLYRILRIVFVHLSRSSNASLRTFESPGIIFRFGSI